MKISTILDHIDSGHMALPEFQRGYVWNRDQVRGLFDSLYRRHPVGSLLVWATQSRTADARGEQELAPGVVKLLLDGQQRITSVYGIIRGRAPTFFDGNESSFQGLRFHLIDERFAFYQPVKMRDDPLWVDVSELMLGGTDGLGRFIELLSKDPAHSSQIGEFVGRLSKVLGIAEIDLHIEELSGEDKTVDVVVDIFNRVNSGGTKLSKGDLALARICGEWPAGRDAMKALLEKWRAANFDFNLDWLLRNVNTITTGEAKFTHLHSVDAARVEDGLQRAERAIDTTLNMISGRLGLDHDRVLFGRYAIPIIAHYLDRRGCHLASMAERDKLLYWYVHSAMWGRFSGSTETVLDQDLALLEDLDGGLDRLIESLRLWHGSLEVRPGHFSGWSLGARFYPVLYLLTRVGEARDWESGLPLKRHLLGRMSSLEVHHIFPRALLYKHEYGRAEVNAVANFCFLTKDSNLQISARSPDEYFEAVESAHPGVLESQWIPMDRDLWNVERYPEFLEARRVLLAQATNGFLAELLNASTPSTESDVPRAAPASTAEVVGGIASEEEETTIDELRSWVLTLGLPEGRTLYEVTDPETGSPSAILDLAWPEGLQPGFSRPTALLLNEGPETLAAANAAGFQYFTDPETFRSHVEDEIVPSEEQETPESEAGRHGSKVWSRYELELGGRQVRTVGRGKTMYEVIQYLVRSGHAPEALHRCFSWRSFSTVFHILPGEIDDVEFPKRAQELDAAFRARRWRLGPGQILHHEGKSYAVIKGWGRRTDEALDRLASKLGGFTARKLVRA